MRKIIVIGGTHHNTLSIIRCLGRVGYSINLILIGKKSFVSKSKYINRIFIIAEESQIPQLLIKNYCNEENSPIIISCSDLVQNCIDCNYDNLKNHFVVFNCKKQGCLTYYMNKQIQDSAAESVGFLTPKSFVYDNDLEEAIYPCMLKPVESINGGKKVFICENKEQANQSISQFDIDTKIQVQQYIKKDYEIVILGMSTQHGIYIPGFIRKHRDYDGGTLYSETFSIDNLPIDVVDKCKKLVSGIGYEGLFGIELIVSNSRYYFIEINLRNDATTYALAIAGVNLPALYVNSYKTGGDSIPESKVKNIKAIVDFNDFKHRKDYNISLMTWLRQYISAECKYYFAIRDIKPFLYAPFKK